MKSNSGTGRLTFRVVNNAVSVAMGGLAYRLISLVTSIWISRVLGGEQYGQFSFIFVYLSFFCIFVEFGLNSILTREMAQQEAGAPRILGNAILFRLGLGIAVLPIALILIRLLDYPLTVQQGILAASLQLFLTVREIFATVYRVKLKMLYSEIWNVSRVVVNLILVAFAAIYRPSLMTFIAAYMVSGFLGLVTFAIFTCRFVAFDFRPDKKLLLGLIRESFPLLLSACFTLIYYRIDVVMLSKMKSFLDVGYYSVATRLTESLGLPATSLFVSLFPLLSRSHKENRADFEHTILKGFKTLLFLGFPIALGGLCTASDLVPLLFGAEYAPSSVTFKILLGYTFFYFLGGFLANILIACGKQRIDAWVSFTLVVANVVLNWILIPRYSYNGAAAATVIVEVTGVILIAVYAARNRAIKMPLPRKEFKEAVVVNAIFLGILLAGKYLLGFSVLGLILFGMVLYGVLLLLFKVITLEQVKLYVSHWGEGKPLHDGRGRD